MTRLLLVLSAVPLLWGQVEGRYYYASLAVKGAPVGPTAMPISRGVIVRVTR